MIKHRAAEKVVRESAVELIGLFNIPNVIRRQLDVQAFDFPAPNDRDDVRSFLHNVRQSNILQTNTLLVGNTVKMSGDLLIACTSVVKLRPSLCCSRASRPGSSGNDPGS